jgi:4-amino-4-deoxychorismate lyase
MSGQSAFWLDGTLTAALPLPDRGLDFGDGVFETLLLQGGEPLFLEQHLQRLLLGLQALGLPDCRIAVLQQLEQVSRAIGNDSPWSALRVSVIRAPGQRGYAPTINLQPRVLITVTPIDRDCKTMSDAATMGVADLRLSTQPVLARIKHLNRLEQVLAAAQAQASGVDECFVLDQQEHLVSVIAGNVFLLCEGELLTPMLVECGVAGTRRQLIIDEWGPAIGLKVRETRLTLADLKGAQEVFYSNSLQTVRPIAKLGDQQWSSHSVCEALFQQYLENLV